MLLSTCSYKVIKLSPKKCYKRYKSFFSFKVIIIILILFIILVGLSFANVTLCENYISMNEAQVSIVVARYNEDVKWLNEFDTPTYKVFLYNKGKPLNANELPRNVVQIDLPNVGREAHTYLYHIVSDSFEYM